MPKPKNIMEDAEYDYYHMTLGRLKSLYEDRGLPSENLGDYPTKKQIIAELQKYDDDKYPEKKSRKIDSRNFVTRSPTLKNQKSENTKYKHIPIQFELTTSITKEMEKKEMEQDFCINVSLFLDEMKNPKFLHKFTTSVLRLMEYKYNFYLKKKKEIQQEQFRAQAKIDKLVELGVTSEYINKIFPMMPYYDYLLIRMEEIISKVENKMGRMTVEKTEKNINDCIQNKEYGLASIVGRHDIKNNIVGLLFAFSKNYRIFINSFLNVALLGGAGTGKTIIAKVFSYIFSKCGILINDTIKIVTRADLVGTEIGHTAPKTQYVLMDSLEAVLFIDEAYQLTPDSFDAKDYGKESVTEIVNFLDKYIGMNIVIVAGYTDLMIKQFFPSNEGLLRRFPYQFILKDYNNTELTTILIRFMESKLNQNLDEKLCDYFFTLVTDLNKLAKKMKPSVNLFQNQAGDMLNLATSIIKIISSAYTLKWVNGNMESDIPIINKGFNEFLKMRGLHFSIK